MKFFKLTIFLALFAASMMFGGFAMAQYWVTDPSSCPQTYSGQNCTPNNVCGINGSTAECFDTGSLTPAGNVTTSNGGSNYSGIADGGFLLNCYALDAAPNPYCDNNGAWWCDRDSDCFNTGRDTTCIASELASSTCSTCRTGGNGNFTYCDGSYTDADGCEIQINVDDCDEIGLIDANNRVDGTCTCVCDANYYDCNASGAGAGDGCEVLDNGYCELAGLPGTWDGPTCTCVIDIQFFKTGLHTQYSTTTPLLWGTQYGDGPLLKLTSNNASTTGGIFYIGNDGKVGVGTSTPGAMLTVGYNAGSQFLVNSSGVVTAGLWNGSPVGLEWGGLGSDLSTDEGFLYISSNTTIASDTIAIAYTDLAATSPLSLTGNTLSIDTSGNWSGSIDNIDFTGGQLDQNAIWYGSAGAAPNELIAGGEGAVLSIVSGAPAWIATSALGLLPATSTLSTLSDVSI